MTVLMAKAPSQDRGQRRVDRLLDAAADLILVHGAEGLKMDMVAKQAATSPGSLYQFFPNRAALLTALAERYGAEIEAIAQSTLQRQAAVPPTSIEQAARDFLEPFLVFYEANPAYVILTEASDRIFAGAGYDFGEDDQVARTLNQVLQPFTASAHQARLQTVCEMLITLTHTAIAAAFKLPTAAKRDWLAELDTLISGYLRSLV
ncbi:TetR/AcrR family transcriptional regulator [Aquidulcibacter sp.]|uniref:TetR/AcrR family transcriptional regulator n=1 Tax=Aquidulcibacter sp. TaxID=2052990 RepID=UPI0025C24FBF|nr:TetR/AcrR family transcriptional regulator [Aquidulcibacter sp.]MCA3697187.1 TetR/AcrR family transcriptional regulator [Aquidulcibacter sp.]